MQSESTRAQKLRDLALQGDMEAFESTWLAGLEDDPEDVHAFLAGVDALESMGQRDRAGLYLSMLAPALMERGHAAQAIPVLQCLARISPRETGLREMIAKAYEATFAAHPHLTTCLEHVDLAGSPDLREALDRLDAYLAFQEGSYVYHAGGWGTGLIASVDHHTLALVIDFKGKPGHRLDMDMARKVTELLQPDDLRAMQLDRMEELRELTQDDPVAIIRATLQSRRGKGRLRDLRERLTSGGAEAVIPAAEWSRWWQKARPKIKSASDVTITPGSNPELELKDVEHGYPDACVRDLRSIDKDSRKLRHFREILKEARNHDEGQAAIVAISASLAGMAPEMALGDRISASLLLREAAEYAAKVEPHPELEPARVAHDHDAVVAALPSVPIAAHRVAILEVLKQSGAQDWPELYRRLVLRGENETADFCIAALIGAGREEAVGEIIETIMQRYREYPRAFAWYLRARVGDKIPDGIGGPDMPSLMEKTLILHNHLDTARSPSQAEIADASKALILVLQARDFAIVRDVFERADTTQGRTLARLIRSNRSLSREIRDKFLAGMLRVRPDLAKVGTAPRSGDSSPEEGALWCTRRSLLRKRQEYERLVNEEIPENAAEIGRAASHGDLSENAEWTAALEKQGMLTTRSQELRRDIDRARIIESNQQDGEQVNLGTRVTIEDRDANRRDYTILGPWEADPDRGIVSYLSPVGRALLGKGAGEDAIVDLATGASTLRVVAFFDGLAAAEAAPAD